MTGRKLAIISRWTTALLVGGMLPFAPAQPQLVGLAFLGIYIATRMRRSGRLLRLGAIAGILVPPLIAESIWNSTRVVLLAVPGLPWLASVLEATASPPDRSSLSLRLRDGRYLTTDAVALLIGLLGAALVGAVTVHPSLLASAGICLAFVGALVVGSLMRIPADFLTAEPPTVRVLARETLEASLPLAPAVRLAARVVIDIDDPWAAVVPRVLVAAQETPDVRLRVTPPLAGSKTLRTRALCSDPWGLTATTQDLILAHVRVIPRATYAAWLAHRYLEGAAAGQLGTAQVEIRIAGAARRGLDYYGARPYEPGDPLRDVFWKHTLKLQQLVVKERRGEYGGTVILAVNVWGTDADDLDRAAFNTLLAALTLAREDVSMVFATYTDEAVLGVTPVLAPRQAVLHALHLVGTMSEVPRPTRMLQPAHLARLRRRVERLIASNTDPARRLARVLQFEYQAYVHRAHGHPAYRAVLTAASRVAAPAALLVSSTGPDDPETIELALEHLRSRGVFPFIAMNGAKMPAFAIPSEHPPRRSREPTPTLLADALIG